MSGQWGHYAGLKVGQRVKVTLYAEVTEVGRNYADVEIEGAGDELTLSGANFAIQVVEAE